MRLAVLRDGGALQEPADSVRIKDWRIVFMFLIFCGVVEICFSATNTTTPLYVHEDPKNQREFQNVYQTMARSPNIYISSGAPEFTPEKVGDMVISTTTVHTYVSTATKDSNSWLQVK